MTHQAPGRFALGSWTDRLPIADQLDHFNGHPSRWERTEEFCKTVSAAQLEMLEQQKSIASTDKYAMAEAKLQHQESQRTREQVSNDIVTSLNQLEQALGAHFEGIRSVLGNVDDKLGAMLKIMVSPLGAEAAELTRDGNTALMNGFPDDAITAFESALEHKKTDYLSLTSLGLALMQKEEVAPAIEAFRKAAAFIPDGAGKDNRAIALENLARAHYVKRDFENAFKFSDQARSICYNRTPASEYRYAVYSLLSGNLIDWELCAERLCKSHPQFFLNFMTDPDLADCREAVVNVLNPLAKSAYDEAVQTREDLLPTIEIQLKELEGGYPEYALSFAFVSERLNMAHEYLQLDTYTLSRRSKIIYEELGKVTALLIELCRSKRELVDLEPRYEALKEEHHGTMAAYHAKEETFNSQNTNELKSSEDTVRSTKTITYWVLGLGASILLFSNIADSMKGENILVILFILPIVAVIAALLIYGVAIVIGSIVASMANAAGEAKKNRIKSRKSGAEYPKDILEKYNSLVAQRDNLSNEIGQLDKGVSQIRNKLQLLVGRK